MVNDKQTHVGCALVHYRRGRLLTSHLACNYSYTNILSEPVYVAGPATSRCRTGKNSAYTGLCSRKENISLAKARF